MSSTVVTRFAPSPTGYLHIGGARTALFNWLYARGRSGQMLLRIEDTDRERSTPEAIAAILDGLSWLGLQWDGDPVFQHERLERHAEIAQRLLAEGKAYRCYASAEELAAMRERARAEGRPVKYDGTWRDRDPADAPKDVPPVIRFKAPLDGETIIEDRVQGKVRFSNSQLDDLIILRSNGTPTYNLSVVVDDHDMGITHVIRGDDHLTNAARQVQIYKALGWTLPEFAHIPLIHGPDGAKLSKRHGAMGVDAYRRLGYLPEALRNYLVRLGWSHGDDEIMSTEQMIEWFDLDAIGRGPARFDFAKLNNLNGHYIRQADDERLVDLMEDALAELADGDRLRSRLPAVRQRLLEAMPSLKERAKTIVELAEGARFLLDERPIAVDERAAALLTAESRALLERLLARLEAHEEWSASALEDTVRNFARDEDAKLGAVAQPVRAALTGSTASPGIFDVMAVLGKEETLGRLRDQCTSSA